MIQNYNIIRFHQDALKVYTDKEFTNGKTSPIITKQRTIPPFQLIRPALTNAPITRFDLVSREDGTVIDVLTEVNNSCLSIQLGGDQENYASGSVAAYATITDAYSWGFTLGTSFDEFRHVVVAVNANDQNAACTTWNSRILSAKGGSVLLTATEVNKIVKIGTTEYIYFDFGEVYDNAALDNLYLEVHSNGKWSCVGDDGLYSGQTVSYNLTASTYPDTDNSPVGEGSAYVRAYAYDGNFDVIVNDGSEYDKYVKQGSYTITISDGIYTWYSEPFYIHDYIKDEIKISYWHNEPFPLPIGNMRYVDGYKNVVRFKGKLGQPKYEYIEEDVEQLGRILPISKTLKKKFSFNFTANKYMLDALNLIWMHHNIEIEVDNELFTVHEFEIVDYEWDEYALHCMCTVEFVADNITTATGHNRSDNNFIEEEVLDLVFPTEINVIDAIEWDYYSDEEIDIADEPTYTNKINKYIVVDNAGNKSLGYYNGSDVVYPALTEGQVVKYYDGTSDTYYFKDANLETQSVIDSVTNIGGTNRRIDGNTFQYASVYIEYGSSDCWDFQSSNWEIGDRTGGGVTGQRFGFNSSQFENINLVIFYKIGQSAGMPDASAFIDEVGVGDIFIIANSGAECADNVGYGRYRVESISRDDAVGEETYPEKRMNVTYLGGATGTIDFYDISMSNIDDMRGAIIGRSSLYDGKELISNGIELDGDGISKFRVVAWGGNQRFTVSDWVNNV